MRFYQKIMAALLLASVTLTANAGDFIEVSKSVTVNKGADEVWQAIGGFCAIKDWHPAVAECEAYDDHGSLYRTLTLADGATVSEKSGGEEANSYTYFVKNGLPVKPYKSTFKAKGDASSTTVTWSSRFKAKGVSDEEAKKLIEGIYDAGLSSITEMMK